MKYLALLILLAGASTAIYVSQSPSMGTSADATVTRPSEPPEQPIVQGMGYVEPLSEVRSLSFKAGGIIGKCHVEIGDRVAAGDVLASLDDAEQRHDLAIAEHEALVANAELADVLSGINPFAIQAAEKAADAAHARVSFAQNEFRRQGELLSRKTISQSDYDRAESLHKQAVAESLRCEADLSHLKNHVTPERQEVAQRKAALAAVRKDAAAQRLADARLLAPCDGTILEIIKREGEAVSALLHEPVLLFGDISQLLVRAEIDERYAHAVRVGQPARVSGRGLGGKTYAGRVSAVKEIMGKKSVFVRSSAERKDLDVLQVWIEMPVEFAAAVGLRVDVAITLSDPITSSH